MPIISIILPIFNVENYLRNALDSILNQTFDIKDIEVIMVDDCSTDDSGVIMDEYSSVYENFISIHLDENSGGAGKPKNIGMKIASSKYILFLDPDDELMEDICEVLYEKLIETNSDIVTANSLRISKNTKEIDIIYANAYEELNPNKNLSLYKPFRACGTLFKKSFLDEHHIIFTRKPTNEDTYFLYECFLNLKKITYLNDYIGLKYYVRDSDEHVSQSNNFNKYYISGTIDAFRDIISLIQRSNPSKDYVNDPFIGHIYWRFTNKWNMCNNDKKYIFEKILDYEGYSPYNIQLPMSYKIMDWFLNKHLFNTLIIIQYIYSSFLKSWFFKKFILPKINRNVME